ncbi:MAG: ABC transporter permease, partial [Actinobacteria bacterium]|nr:ABC transporter permease [Actinomycetota bacterium]
MNLEHELPLTKVRPPKRQAAFRLGELWAYRELLYFLVWRDVKVRYKQAALGAAWVVLQPLLMVALFSLIFGPLLDVQTGGIPYPLFVFAGLLPWQIFATALAQSANSLVTNQQLITKIYFPRLLLPLAAVLAGLVDFAVTIVLLVALMLWYGVGPSPTVLLLPLIVPIVLLTALSVGTWLSALNVRYRDVQHLVPFLTQFWFFATPIAYSSTMLPESWRSLLGLNPMAGAV